MFTTYLLFCSALITFLPIEAKLSDSIDFLSSLDLQLDEELTRVRREACSSTATEDEISNKRLTALANVIRKASQKNFNISIIGFQDVYVSSGRLKSVDSVELAFPIREDAEILNFLDGANYDDDLYDRRTKHITEQIASIKKIQFLDEVKSHKILVDVIVEGQDEHTDFPVLFHWSPISTYFRADDGMVTVNVTQTAPEEEVKNLIEKLSSSDLLLLRPLVLVYDEDGNLKLNEVKIKDPSIIGYVVDSWQASDEIILRSPTIMTEIVLTFKKERIPEQLARSFKQEFPQYDWRVIVNIDEFYLNEDVWIKLSTDVYEFYEGEKDIYFVYGIKF